VGVRFSVWDASLEPIKHVHIKYEQSFSKTWKPTAHCTKDFAQKPALGQMVQTAYITEQVGSKRLGKLRHLDILPASDEELLRYLGSAVSCITVSEHTPSRVFLTPSKPSAFAEICLHSSN